MTHLVNGGEDRACKVTLVIVVGDAHVAVAVIVGVGVFALPHSRLVFVEEHHAAEILAERLLLCGGKDAFGKRGVHALLRRKHLFQEGNKLAFDERKERVVLFGGHAAFKLVEQNIVPFEFLRLLPHGILALERENFAEIGLDRRERAAVLCLHELRIRFQNGVLKGEVLLLRHFGEFIGVALCLLDLVFQDGIERGAVLVKFLNAFCVFFPRLILVRHGGKLHKLAVAVQFARLRHTLLFPRMQEKRQRKHAEAAVDILVIFLGASGFCVHKNSLFGKPIFYAYYSTPRACMQARGGKITTIYQPISRS